MRLTTVIRSFALVAGVALVAPAIAFAQKAIPSGSYVVDARENSPMGQQYKGWTMEVKANSMSASNAGQVYWAATFTTRGDTVEFSDRPDVQASCGDVRGVYVWKTVAGKIQFDLVSDGCDGRRDGLTSILMVKQPAK
jgi:hypothetical protein